MPLLFLEVIMLYRFTRAELKTKNASDFKEGDVIKTGRYFIFISYKVKDRDRKDTGKNGTLPRWLHILKERILKN